jgi:hypothetical protein
MPNNQQEDNPSNMSFTYLGSIVTSDGDMDKDVKAILNKARVLSSAPRASGKQITCRKTKINKNL